jgi:tetratricopeptide (TPR) repeat protein
MTIPSLHFPHISRIFSAKVLSWAGNLVLWVLFLALVSVNVFLWAKPLAYSDRIFQIFTHPFSATTHEDLAQALRYSGERTLADQELALVAELSPVLGADTTAKAQRREADKMYWQHILATHPDYRDAYIQLAALSYQDGNLTQANAYLVQAQTLDPNNATVNRLTSFTSKLLE